MKCSQLIRSLAPMLILGVMIALPLVPAPANAGLISTPNLTPIYSQSTFLSPINRPITINWLTPGAPIVNPSLTIINTDAELNTLFSLGPDNSLSRIVDVYFVDSILACGGPGTGIIGCANTPGNDIVVRSSFAAGTQGATLIAHELGHSLGLPHQANSLMSATISSNTTLHGTQVNAIFSNAGGFNLIQTGVGGNRFINLRPIAVIAVAVVPEPETYVLLLAGLGLIGLATIRRRREV